MLFKNKKVVERNGKKKREIWCRKEVKMCKGRAPQMVLQDSIYRQNVAIKLIKVK